MLFIDDASLKSRGDLSHISFSSLFPDYLPVPSFICWSDFHHGRCQLPPERDNRCLRLQDMPPEASQMRMHSKYFLFISYPSQPNVKYVLYQLQTAESFEFLRSYLPIPGSVYHHARSLHFWGFLHHPLPFSASTNQA